MDYLRLRELEKKLMDELAERRRLGGFDTHAMTILLLLETVYEMLRHLADKETPPRKISK